MITNVASIVSTYFQAWQADDFDTLASVLADDVTFVGPLGEAHNAEEYLVGIKGLSQIKTDIKVQKVFVDGPDVLTWFDLHTVVAVPIPVANWTHVEDGRITRVRVTFDARPLTTRPTR
jgi:ketosteroid isomerase-like protein